MFVNLFTKLGASVKTKIRSLLLLQKKLFNTFAPHRSETAAANHTNGLKPLEGKQVYCFNFGSLISLSYL